MAVPVKKGAFEVARDVEEEVLRLGASRLNK